MCYIHEFTSIGSIYLRDGWIWSATGSFILLDWKVSDIAAFLLSDWHWYGIRSLQKIIRAVIILQLCFGLTFEFWWLSVTWCHDVVVRVIRCIFVSIVAINWHRVRVFVQVAYEYFGLPIFVLVLARPWSINWAGWVHWVYLFKESPLPQLCEPFLLFVIQWEALRFDDSLKCLYVLCSFQDLLSKLSDWYKFFFYCLLEGKGTLHSIHQLLFGLSQLFDLLILLLYDF